MYIRVCIWRVRNQRASQERERWKARARARRARARSILLSLSFPPVSVCVFLSFSLRQSLSLFSSVSFSVSLTRYHTHSLALFRGCSLRSRSPPRSAPQGGRQERLDHRAISRACYCPAETQARESDRANFRHADTSRAEFSQTPRHTSKHATSLV